MSKTMSDIEFKILKQRAEQLAKTALSDSVPTKMTTLLEFRSIDTRFAIELSNVSGISKIGDILSIPLTPKHIPGIIRQHGQTLALVSLKFFFYPEAEGVVDSDYAVLVNINEKRFAIQAEEIEGVNHMEEKQILPVPDNYDKKQANFLKGVTQNGLAILDLEKLLKSANFTTSRLN